MSRCNLCKKKLGALEYKCKCGNLYCITHLHAELHSCTYDYKEDGKEQIKKQIDVGKLVEKVVKI